MLGINLQAKRQFCSMSARSGCGEVDVLRLRSAEKPDSQITLDASPLAEPDRNRAWYFSVVQFSHTSTCWISHRGLELPASPLFGRLFAGRKHDARTAQRILEKVGLGHAE